MITSFEQKVEDQMNVYSIPHRIKKDVNLIGDLIDDLEFVGFTRQHLSKYGKTEQGLEILDVNSKLTKMTGVNFSDMSTDVLDMYGAMENLVKTIWDGIVALIKGVAKLIAKVFHGITFGIFKDVVTYGFSQIDTDKLESHESEIPSYAAIVKAQSLFDAYFKGMKQLDKFVTVTLSHSNCPFSADVLNFFHLKADVSSSGHFVIRTDTNSDHGKIEEKSQTFSAAGWTIDKFNQVAATFKNGKAAYQAAGYSCDLATKKSNDLVKKMEHEEHSNTPSPETTKRLRYLHDFLLTLQALASALLSADRRTAVHWNKLDKHILHCTK